MASVSDSEDRIVAQGFSIAHYQLGQFDEALLNWLTYMQLKIEGGEELDCEDYAYLNGLHFTLEITSTLNQRRPVARNTVRTLMERMEEKGWLTHRVEGRSYIYSALLPREESLGQRVLDMVDKVCGDNPEKLMMALLQYRGLSDDEAERMRVILDEAKVSETVQTKEGMPR